MAVRVHLKNEFTEDEKCHNLMTWLIYFCLQNKEETSLPEPPEELEGSDQEALRKELEEFKRQAEQYKEELLKKDKDLEQYKKQLSEMSEKTPIDGTVFSEDGIDETESQEKS